jgi:hypothetical protein
MPISSHCGRIVSIVADSNQSNSTKYIIIIPSVQVLLYLENFGTVSTGRCVKSQPHFSSHREDEPFYYPSTLHDPFPVMQFSQIHRAFGFSAIAHHHSAS